MKKIKGGPMKLYIKKLRDNAIIPKQQTSGSAGYDLSACIDSPITINPNEIVKIPTGLSVALDENNAVILIYARSSLATKYGLTLANCVGVVDSDYRGEIMVAMINQGKEAYTINNGERIAQMVITPIFTPEIVVSDELSETDRGTGGFGSTGKK
jgi:dUTP pyrophosphatase